jgi:hypothetical protein
MEEANESAVSAETRTKVGELRHALLRLHKALLDDERARYEKARGGVESSGALLQLVLNDEWFAYLRPLSSLVVQMDELLDADEASEREAGALVALARELLTFDEKGEGGLGERYRAALQRAPEVVMAHAAVVRLLGERKAV